MIPAVEMAVTMAAGPAGAKPWEVKFAGLPIVVVPMAVTGKTTITRTMMASFHQTSTLLIGVKSFTP